MANSVGYFSEYMNMVDRIYKEASCTAIFEANQGEFRTSNVDAKTIYLKEMSLAGLGDYSRSTGYSTAGDVTIAWTAYTFAMDRARKFYFDAADEIEAQTSAAELAAEFYRTQVIPELDAYRIEKICTLAGLDVSADLTYDTVIAAIDAGILALDNAQAGKNRALLVSNEVYSLMKQSGEFFNARISSQNNGIINRDIVTFDNMPLIRVPSDRFYTNFDFNAGATGNAGGFASAAGAKVVNFIMADIKAITAVIKHQAPKLVAPEYNTDADGYVFGLRVYHDLFIPTNKVNGVYVHTKS